jgi:23S rRNA pseudouridine1911/1915/1917 synthase
MTSLEKVLSYIHEENTRVRADVIVQTLTGKSRSIVRGMFSHKCVRVKDTICLNPGEPLGLGDTVQLTYDPVRRYKESPKARSSELFDVIFEDEHILVVDKKAGFLTVPTEKRESRTLVSALSNYLTRGESKRKLVSIIHRLDRDTSGILVFGKNDRIAEAIKQQFIARKPKREYFAIVAGRLEKDTGTFQSYLVTDRFLNQKSTNNENEGKLAITHYRVVQRLSDATLVSVTLETGRRNQIRVHFSDIGHPIIGDVRYKSQEASHKAWPHKRLALHAAVLGLKHPVTSAELEFKSEMPVEFRSFLLR